MWKAPGATSPGENLDCPEGVVNDEIFVPNILRVCRIRGPMEVGLDFNDIRGSEQGETGRPIKGPVAWSTRGLMG